MNTGNPQPVNQQNVAQQPQQVNPQNVAQQPQQVNPQNVAQQPQQVNPQNVAQQPQQMYQQPQGQAFGAGFNTSFNTGKLATDLQTNYMKLISMVGALLIFIAPFFHWMSIKVEFDSFFSYSEKMKANMFAMAGSKHGIGEGVYVFYAIMFLIIGILLIATALADYIPALQNIKSKIPYVEYVELGLIVLALLFTILAMANGNLSDGIKDIKEAIHEDYAKGHANRGIGPVIAFLGIIASAFPRVLKLITGKKY
jgi:hypothetical protein